MDLGHAVGYGLVVAAVLTLAWFVVQVEDLKRQGTFDCVTWKPTVDVAQRCAEAGEVAVISCNPKLQNWSDEWLINGPYFQATVLNGSELHRTARKKLN